MVNVKRVYSTPHPADGFRVLVDRLWPRGLTKEKAAVGLWLREIAPSDALRKWFGHDPAKWAEFRNRYRQELAGKQELLEQICRAEKEHGTVALLFAAHDEQLNNAVALREILAARGTAQGSSKSISKSTRASPRRKKRLA